MGEFGWMKTSVETLLPPLYVRSMGRRSSEIELLDSLEHRGTTYHQLQLGNRRILVNPDTYLIYALIRNTHDMATQGELESWENFWQLHTH